jgi:hypothetical protein
MKTINNIPEFSVFGGPLSKFGKRLKLVRNGTDSIRFGIAIGLITWLLLLLFSFLGGSLGNFFSINVLAGHVRFLAVIPLFFICESWVGPRMGEFVRNIVNSGVIPESEQPALFVTIRRILRLKDSWVIEALLFLIMFVLPVIDTHGFLPGKSSNTAFLIQQAGGKLTLTNIFYIGFCLPLFRFLLVRWLWHLGIWWYFLFRLQKLKLKLIPTHSDGEGGLGYLEVVQEHFTPLAVAFSALLSASFAEEIIAGTLPFEALYYLIPAGLILNLLFFVAPLLMFSSQLWMCRVNGLNDYMVMASHYVDAFDQTWVKDENATGQSQLGSGDIQSLADLTNSVRVVREMQTVPVSRRLIMAFIVSSIIPFLPFVFMKLNFDEVVVRLFKIIAG